MHGLRSRGGNIGQRPGGIVAPCAAHPHAAGFRVETDRIHKFLAGKLKSRLRRKPPDARTAKAGIIDGRVVRHPEIVVEPDYRWLEGGILSEHLPDVGEKLGRTRTRVVLCSGTVRTGHLRHAVFERPFVLVADGGTDAHVHVDALRLETAAEIAVVGEFAHFILADLQSHKCRNHDPVPEGVRIFLPCGVDLLLFDGKHAMQLPEPRCPRSRCARIPPGCPQAVRSRNDRYLPFHIRPGDHLSIPVQHRESVDDVGNRKRHRHRPAEEPALYRFAGGVRIRQTLHVRKKRQLPHPLFKPVHEKRPRTRRRHERTFPAPHHAADFTGALR